MATTTATSAGGIDGVIIFCIQSTTDELTIELRYLFLCKLAGHGNFIGKFIALLEMVSPPEKVYTY